MFRFQQDVPGAAHGPEGGKQSSNSRRDGLGPSTNRLSPNCSKASRDIARAERGAISPDRDDLVIAERAERLDRVFEALREIGPPLTVEANPFTTRFRSRGEDVDICHDRRLTPERWKLQERERCNWQPATREIELRLLGKDQQCAAWHRGGRHSCISYSQIERG